MTREMPFESLDCKFGLNFEPRRKERKLLHDVSVKHPITREHVINVRSENSSGEE